MSDHEDEVLARYSTPGLRRGELNRAEHRRRLASSWKDSSDEIEKILNDVHPPEPKETR